MTHNPLSEFFEALLAGIVSATSDTATRDVDPEFVKQMRSEIDSEKEWLRDNYSTHEALLEYAAFTKVRAKKAKECLLGLVENLTSDSFARTFESTAPVIGLLESDFTEDPHDAGRNIYEMIKQSATDTHKNIQSFYVNIATSEARARSSMKGQHASHARLEKDPKQIDKARAKEYWLRWQKEPGLYKSQREFAEDMIEKFGIDAGGSLTSVDTIKNKWIPEWRAAKS